MDTWWRPLRISMSVRGRRLESALVNPLDRRGERPAIASARPQRCRRACVHASSSAIKHGQTLRPPGCRTRATAKNLWLVAGERRSGRSLRSPYRRCQVPTGSAPDGALVNPGVLPDVCFVIGIDAWREPKHSRRFAIQADRLACGTPRGARNEDYPAPAPGKLKIKNRLSFLLRLRVTAVGTSQPSDAQWPCREPSQPRWTRQRTGQTLACRRHRPGHGWAAARRCGALQVGLGRHPAHGDSTRAKWRAAADGRGCRIVLTNQLNHASQSFQVGMASRPDRPRRSGVHGFSCRRELLLDDGRKGRRPD